MEGSVVGDMVKRIEVAVARSAQKACWVQYKGSR